MKVALLGLAAAITVVAQDGSKGQVQYGKPSYNDDGYGKPTKKPSYKETRTPKPKPTTDPKKPFDQFYDNLKLCKAEGDLALCIATAQSRHDCLSDKRVNLCTSQFVTGLCSELATTTTGTYNNGYFSATTDSCVDAALADSLLVYNKLLREVNTALAITTQFDQWTFTTVKLALASTRNHADCVIKSFFNFLTQSANNKALRKQDRECLDEALNNSNCKWAQDQTDGWNLPAFLKRYGDLAFNQVLRTLESRFGTSQKSQLNHAISDLLEAVKDQNTQFVEFINSDYDFTHRTTTVNLCSDTNPEHSVGFKDKDGKVIGADATKIKFHLPIHEDGYGWYKESPTAWKRAKGDKVPPIVATCEAFYKSTKESYDSDVEKGTSWSAFKVKTDSSFIGRRGKNWDVECIQGDDVAADGCKSFSDKEVDQAVSDANKVKPTKVKTFGADDKVDAAHRAFVRKTRDSISPVNDRCVGLSGHFIKFLETGETKAVKFGDATLTFGDYTVSVKSPQCKAASWIEPHSCNSHLTQWEQHVTCCKSYHTVVKEFQAAWDNKYGRPSRPDRYLEQDFADQKGYSEPKSTPDRPTCVPDKYNTEETIYEKVLLSKADTLSSKNGGLYSLYSIPNFFNQVLTTDDIKNVDAALTALEVADIPYWTRWGHHCAHVYKATKGKNVPFASTWCEQTKEWLNAHAGHTRVQEFAADKDNSEWLAYKTKDSDRIDGDAPALADYDEDDTSSYSHYLSSSSSYKRLCQTLKRSWDLDTVVPIVSTKCFPQSCVLAQLAKCMDVPEKVEAGYEYVTEPQPGYNGYRNNYYQRSMMALESVNTGVLAMAGFVAGAAVVVVAQVMLKARTTGAASNYLLV